MGKTFQANFSVVTFPSLPALSGPRGLPVRLAPHGRPERPICLSPLRAFNSAGNILHLTRRNLNRLILFNRMAIAPAG